MNESTNKRFVIVGVFVFIALLFLGAGIFLVGDLHKAFEKKIEVVSLFDDVAGLQKGNNIWLSGVKVGIVSDMSFYGNSKVKVIMQIDSKAEQFIPSDSKVRISSDGLIGNRILVIYGGSENTYKLQNGDTLLVEKSLSSEDMMNTFQKSNENLLAITNDVKAITDRLVKGEGSIGKLLNQDSIYQHINAATLSLQQTMLKAQKVVNSLLVFTDNLNKEGTSINELTTDTVIYRSLKRTVIELQQIADSVSVVISTINQDANNPTTPVGVMLKDEKTGSHLKETIKNLESGSKKLDEDLEALQHSTLLKRYFKKKEK